MKIVEKSGLQLRRLFQRIYAPDRCHWTNCPVCEHSESKGSSKCRVANVVYKAKCLKCLEDEEARLLSEQEVGVYIGETSRLLIKRAMEHVTGAGNVDLDNFKTKHWATRHRDQVTFPKMRFKVLKHCKDASTRQVRDNFKQNRNMEHCPILA